MDPESGLLLISVRNLAEARIAIAAGSAVVDLKEPMNGPLGPVSPGICREVAEFARHARAARPALPGACFSLALGELRDWRGEETGAPDVFRFLKLGLAGMAGLSDWPETWRAALAFAETHSSRVLVAYADSESCAAPPPEAVLEAAHDTGCECLMIDTFQKAGRTSLDCLGLGRLSRIVETARSRKISVALAGALGLREIPQLISLRPAILGFRGAACDGGREGSLSEDKIRRLRQAIDRENQTRNPTQRPDHCTTPRPVDAPTF